MLATHHDCGAPCQVQREIVCPICSSSSVKPGNMPVRETDAVVSQDADEPRNPVGLVLRQRALSSSMEPLKVPNLESERLAQNRVNLRMTASSR